MQERKFRVCEHCKPGLNLPKDQKRLDKYTAEFHSLVEQYREQLLAAGLLEPTKSKSS